MRKLALSLLAGMLSLLSFSVYSQDSFTMSSTSFTGDESLPVTLTCDGTGTSPEIEWSNIPANTQSFALILSDPDAPGGTFYHWVIYNIPSSETSIPEGGPIPETATLGLNSTNKPAYYPPCPPTGTTHRYIIQFYALDTKLDLPAVGTDAKAVQNAMKNHIIGMAQMSATYTKK